VSYALLLLGFGVGLICGRWLFCDTRPRPLLNIKLGGTSGGSVFSRSQCAGLLASVLVQKFPRLIPRIVLETDMTLVFKHPRPHHKIHYMFVPKRDIKNIGELSVDERAHIVDLFACMVICITRLGIRDYKIWSNGPGKQDVTYLHFHLGGDD